MKQYSSLLVIGLIVLIFIIIVTSSTFITIKPGERGVIFRKFTTGLDKEHIFKPGFHVIAPWNEMHVYEVKEQKLDEGMDILDKNGLTVHVDVTCRFHPLFEKIGYLHEAFGVHYRERLLLPEIRSSVRKVMGRYEAEEIYSKKRTEVEAAIIAETKEVLFQNNVEMTALLVRSISLPQKIRAAIDEKLKQEQEAAAYRYRLEKENLEAKRKIISARADSTSNAIISSSLTEKLLKMRGIEATIELSKSPNSKVIVVGSGKNGLPLILGNN